MNKRDYIDYWVQTAEKDWKATEHLCDKGDYLQSLFFAHLVLEKLCKAHWVKDNKPDIPPRTHNLVYLAENTQLSLMRSQLDFLGQ